MSEKLKLATFAGGCFWCIEAIFLKLEGVEKVVSGYTGGNIKNPAYREICTGRTGHAEAIQITFNDNKISFSELLEVFFATHDPTTLNRQGNDVGTQYRSAIFYSDENQKNTAEEFLRLLEKETIFKDPIVTEITALGIFYLAEEDHKNYYNLNKEQPYCHFVIQPKLKKLVQYFNEKLKKE